MASREILKQAKTAFGKVFSFFKIFMETFGWVKKSQAQSIEEHDHMQIQAQTTNKLLMRAKKVYFKNTACSVCIYYTIADSWRDKVCTRIFAVKARFVAAWTAPSHWNNSSWVCQLGNWAHEGEKTETTLGFAEKYRPSLSLTKAWKSQLAGRYFVRIERAHRDGKGKGGNSRDCGQGKSQNIVLAWCSEGQSCNCGTHQRPKCAHCLSQTCKAISIIKATLKPWE